ncbi:MAG: hypothetical protein M0D55_06890 [Elusimicrobiota bacterium]|nr:MAG: hypothetical protein M0D55_06890 [Elusimicrobiota bacterium]
MSEQASALGQQPHALAMRAAPGRPGAAGVERVEDAGGAQGGAGVDRVVGPQLLADVDDARALEPDLGRILGIGEQAALEVDGHDRSALRRPRRGEPLEQPGQEEVVRHQHEEGPRPHERPCGQQARAVAFLPIRRDGPAHGQVAHERLDLGADAAGLEARDDDKVARSRAARLAQRAHEKRQPAEFEQRLRPLDPLGQQAASAARREDDGRERCGHASAEPVPVKKRESKSRQTQQGSRRNVRQVMLLDQDR